MNSSRSDGEQAASMRLPDGLKQTWLESRAARPPAVHVWSREEREAIDAALAVGRPLLVRGEPGTGKSQLARAAAHELGRHCYQHVVTSHTDLVEDLLYRFDAVRRLAQAQLVAALPGVLSAVTKAKAGSSEDEEKVVQRVLKELGEKLEEWRFVQPGPLWWALSGQDARKHCTRSGATMLAPMDEPGGQGSDAVDRGAVLLLDEIDKAEASIPNGLLGVLDDQMFEVLGSRRVEPKGPAPLVMLTANTERELPEPFVRRCLVLHLEFPSPEELERHGRAHFGQDARERLERWSGASQGGGRRSLLHPVNDDAIKKAVEMLLDDRASALEEGLYAPGQAELIDTLRAVARFESAREQLEAVDVVSRYTLDKSNLRQAPAS